MDASLRVGVNITQFVLTGQAIHITEPFHLRNVNFTHHMLGRNYGIEKLKNILIVRDVGRSTSRIMGGIKKCKERS